MRGSRISLGFERWGGCAATRIGVSGVLERELGMCR